MGRLSFFIALPLILLTTARALAESTEAKERVARKACLSGDYIKGVDILSDLFIDTKEPNFIYNQARCFEQNNRFEEAISRFREYLRKVGKISAADKLDVENHIRDCQELLATKELPKAESTTKSHSQASQSAGQNLPLKTKSPTLNQTTQSQATPGVPEALVVTENKELSSAPGRGLRIAGIACSVVGLASIGTGIYYYTQALSYSKQVSNQEIPESVGDRNGTRAETMQWVFYGVGATTIATGTILYLLGWQRMDSPRTLSGVVPIFGKGIAGISAQGTF